MAESGPTEEELAAAKSYLKAPMRCRSTRPPRSRAQLTQIQLDGLGIDYMQRRSALIDSVTLDDAKRAAKRLFGGGMLVTVVGRPKGLVSSRASGERVSLIEALRRKQFLFMAGLVPGHPRLTFSVLVKKAGCPAQGRA